MPTSTFLTGATSGLRVTNIFRVVSLWLTGARHQKMYSQAIVLGFRCRNGPTRAVGRKQHPELLAIRLVMMMAVSEA
jgi:hypothetical protein